MGISPRMAKFWWFVAAVAAVVTGIGLALWRAPHSVELPADEGPVSGSPPAPMPAPPTLAQQDVAPPDANAPPPGLTAEQWQSLRKELAGRPDELRRVTDYLGFADTLRRFRDGSAADRKALAATLDSGIEPRLQQRELSAAEARLIKIAVLQELLPDEPQRVAALRAWEDRQRAAARPDPAVAAREAEFQRRQAEIVAAWQAQPAAQRDTHALERQLEALRLSSFTPTTHR